MECESRKSTDVGDDLPPRPLVAGAERVRLALTGPRPCDSRSGGGSCVERSDGGHGLLPADNPSTSCPEDLVGFLLFMTASLTELTGPPFDMPIADSEIIFGALTEYT